MTWYCRQMPDLRVRFGPERFVTAVMLLRQLQGDFRAVEESFRDITIQVQQRQVAGRETRGKILEFALDAEDLLKQVLVDFGLVSNADIRGGALTNASCHDLVRTLHDFLGTLSRLDATAVIILDEGQNTTVPQMKMFLTRMGHGSKIIVTGDVTQVDLPRPTRSGLIDAVHRLRAVDRIGIVYLSEHDIVRHPLVQKIVQAYEDDKPRKRKES